LFDGSDNEMIINNKLFSRLKIEDPLIRSLVQKKQFINSLDDVLEFIDDLLSLKIKEAIQYIFTADKSVNTPVPHFI
jgi:hypothetical protein